MPHTGEKIVYILKALSMRTSAFRAEGLFWPALKKKNLLREKGLCCWWCFDFEL